MKNIKDLSCDYLIIGGGTIGLPVSVWLAEKTNKNIICVEAGPSNKTIKDLFGNPRIFGDEYHGAEEGRRFGLGGTSSIWGGALAPFLQNDCNHYDWPVSSEDLKQFYTDIEDLFDLPENSWPNIYSDEKNKNYVLRHCLWPSFRKRNVYINIRKKAKKLSNLKILYESPVTKIKLDDSKSEVTIQNRKTSNIITSKNIIVCAGALESTRLALSISNNKSIGNGFSDHLSAPVAKIITNNSNNLNSKFSFKFLKNGSMIARRFELSNNSIHRKNIPPHNFHISSIKINDNNVSPFTHIREILRALQERKIPKIGNIFGIFANTPWFIKFVYWFFYKRTVLWPQNSSPELHLVIQQNISDKNFITLDHKNLDPFGNPLVKINWRVEDQDIKNINSAIEAFKKFWNEAYFYKYGELDFYDKHVIEKNIKQCGGIYHPTSSLSFGEDMRHPVDKNLYLKGKKNIQFVSTAVLPTGGGINPTMTALLLGARCVHQHVNKN